MTTNDINGPFIKQDVPTRLWQGFPRSANLPGMPSEPHPESVEAIHQRLLDLYAAFAALIGQPSMPKAEFARRMGITPQLFQIITTKNRLSLDTALAISKGTGATLDYIFIGSTSALPAALAVEIGKIQEARKPTSRRRA